MLIAVRTVAETDDLRTIEGLAFPFKGRDTYGTFFSARTDYHWDLFPDVDPAATRADVEPAFVRPVTYHHGFDPDFGLARVGGWSPIRMDADGVWVRAQIDKRQKFYATRIKPLLDEGALGLSGGSAEHSVRIDQRTGEVLDWPAYELAMTPVESNPLAVIATRSAEITSTLRIVDGAIRGWLPEGTTQGDLDDGDFAWIATDKSLPDSERRKLPYKIHGKVNEDGWKAAWSRVNQAGTDFAGGPSQAEVRKKLLADKPADVTVAAKAGVRFHSAGDAATGAQILAGLTRLMAAEADEPDQLALLQGAADNVSQWIDLERAEIGASGTDEDETDYSPAYYSGARAGRRNSAADEAVLTSAHDSIASVLGMDCAPGDASARSADGVPALRLVADVEPPDDDLAALATRTAQEAAAEAVRRLTG